MSNLNKSIWQLVKEAYLPAIFVFFAIVAGATCIGSKPFFPVGLSGIVVLVSTVYCAYLIYKKAEEVDELKVTLDAAYSSAEVVGKKYKSELAKKDEDIKTLKAEISLLNANIKTLQEENTKFFEEQKAKEEVKEEVKEEPVKEEKKTKTSKKKK